jgi:hypothetical protein
MNLYYVDHSVMTTKRFALIAKDEDDLKRIIAEREVKVLTMFTSKAERDKSGATIAYKLSPAWGGGCACSPWDGK